jgi:glycosyltransferase involved in cell wall biosynthesis
MPVHNGLPYLGRAVESILRQTWGEFELLLIDDASTDGSGDFLSALEDPRIRLVRHERNLDLVATLNEGLNLARGEYVARMDQDDISLPERLEKQVAFLERHGDVGVVAAGARLIDGADRPGAVLPLLAGHGLLRWSLCFGCPIAHAGVMLRRSVILELGAYREEAFRCEDYDLWTRAAERTRLAMIPEVLLHLRRHAASMTRVWPEDNVRNALKVAAAHIRTLLDEEPPPGALRTLWLQEIGEPAGAMEAADWIGRLCAAMLADPALAPGERRGIRLDAAARLFVLFARGVSHPALWPALGRSLKMDPLVVFRQAWSAGRRHFPGMAVS